VNNVGYYTAATTIGGSTDFQWDNTAKQLTVNGTIVGNTGFNTSNTAVNAIQAPSGGVSAKFMFATDSHFWQEEATPALTIGGQARVYADSIAHTLKISENGGSYVTIATASGTLTNGHCVSINASGNFIDAGAACGAGGGSQWTTGTASSIYYTLGQVSIGTNTASVLAGGGDPLAAVGPIDVTSPSSIALKFYGTTFGGGMFWQMGVASSELQWRDSGSNLQMRLGTLSGAAYLNTPPITAIPTDVSSVALTVRAFTASTADLFDAKNSAGSTLAWIDSTGTVHSVGHSSIVANANAGIFQNNSTTASALVGWALGGGSSVGVQAIGGLAVSGHIFLSGTAPTTSSSGCSVVAGSTDNAGSVTCSPASPGIVITFAAAYPTAPFCVSSTHSAAGNTYFSQFTTATQMSMFFPALGATGDQFWWACYAH
jgi:hypothetical protein